MWIFLGILAFIIVVITIIAFLPVHIVFKTDETGELVLYYQILWKKFGEDPDPNDPIVRTLKENTGVSRLEREQLKKQVAEGSLLQTLKESASLIISLLKRLLDLLQYGKVRTLHVDVVCADKDPSKLALEYGLYNATIMPVVSFIHCNLKVRKRGEQINIVPDFHAEKGSFRFEFVLTVPLIRAIIVLFRAAFDEAARMREAEGETMQNKMQK